MTSPTELKDVPRNLVGNRVQNAIDAGATKVECEKQPDPSDKWTVRSN